MVKQATKGQKEIYQDNQSTIMCFGLASLVSVVGSNLCIADWFLVYLLGFISMLIAIYSSYGYLLLLVLPGFASYKMANYCEYRYHGGRVPLNNNINHSEDNLLTICHELSAQDLRHSEKSVGFAKLVIQKLFRDSNVDLCSIMQPTNNSSDHPFNLVHNLIHSKSSFFETILDADDSLSNELWTAIAEQADRTHQPVVQSTDSVMMQCVSYYVTRLLPIDATPIQLMRPCGGQSQRMRTPLDLFMPNSPILNRIKFDSPDFFSSSLHPRHLTIFCNFVSALCSTDQFPSANRLMILRYLLKQFHVFCLHEGSDPDLASIKSVGPLFAVHGVILTLCLVLWNVKKGQRLCGCLLYEFMKTQELIENIEPILRDSDSSMGTVYMVDEATRSESFRDMCLTMGTLSRLVMDPPCPNVLSPVPSPVFSKTLKVTPPSLRIRMGKEEDIEKERKSYESDAVWFARKAFLMRHWDNVPRSAPKYFGITDKLKQIKITILQVEVGGATEIQISNLVVFRHKFVQPEINYKECAVNAVVETFLHGGEPSVMDKLIIFDGATPDICYRNSLLRSLNKAQKLIGKDKTYKALCEILARVNLSVSQYATHLQGWSQKMDIRAGDLLLSSRVLTKGECVKAKFDAAVDEMSAQICNIIRDGPINIIVDERGLELRY
uniref:Pecanex-like protein n=1 Tax=Heterorhabditis bacteriophora TaxID=37862 RepID=A0A1I7XEH7_HETBA